MFNHFMRLLGRAAEDFPTILGGNWISLFLPLVVWAIREGNALRRGWASMSVQFWKDTKILGCVYAALFVWAVIHTTYRDHMDLADRVSKGHLEIAQNANLLTNCQTNLANAGSTIRDKQGLVDTLQKTMISMQGPEAQQQANIASCINNLAKMNPRISEEIVVISIPLATINEKGLIVGPGTLLKKYVSEVFVTTNQVEPLFHGMLKCKNDFIPLSSPQIAGTSQTVFQATAAPQRFSSHEYEISTTISGTEWSPARPAYLTVKTDESSPGECTFTPEGR